MKKKLVVAAAMLLALGTGTTFAQHPQNNERPKQPGTFQQAPRQPQHPGHEELKAAKSGPSAKAKVKRQGLDPAIVKAFPTAKTITKGEKMTQVFDANQQLLGYVVYSQPASSSIRGYKGETPLLIALTTKKKISSVQLLANSEGPRYVRSVEQAGLLKSWDGLKIKKARKKKVDAVSGATFTSRSIIESLRAALAGL